MDCTRLNVSILFFKCKTTVGDQRTLLCFHIDLIEDGLRPRGKSSCGLTNQKNHGRCILWAKEKRDYQLVISTRLIASICDGMQGRKAHDRDSFHICKGPLIVNNI